MSRGARLSCNTASIALVCVCMVSGCGWLRSDSKPVKIHPQAIAAWHGQPRAVAATLLLRTADAAGESLQITLHLWRSADGRTRLLVTKIDVDVLQALVQADGSFTAFAPRSGLRTTGDFADPQLPAGLADLRLLIGEVCEGPLSPALAAVAQATPEFANVLTGPVAAGVTAAVTATVTLDPQSEQVREKVLRDDRGRLLYHLRYLTYTTYDECHRPSKVDGKVGDGGTLTAYLRRFDSLGDISAERMRLTIPDTARAVPVTDFLEHLEP